VNDWSEMRSFIGYFMKNHRTNAEGVAEGSQWQAAGAATGYVVINNQAL
jgi:hypothetical protein